MDPNILSEQETQILNSFVASLFDVNLRKTAWEPMRQQFFMKNPIPTHKIIVFLNHPGIQKNAEDNTHWGDIFGDEAALYSFYDFFEELKSDPIRLYAASSYPAIMRGALLTTDKDRPTRLIDILADNSFEPNLYYNTQNAALYDALEPEILKKAVSDFLGLHDQQEEHQFATAFAQRPPTAELRNYFLRYQQRCLDYWKDFSQSLPQYSEIVASQKEVIKKFEEFENLLQKFPDDTERQAQQLKLIADLILEKRDSPDILTAPYRATILFDTGIDLRAGRLSFDNRVAILKSASTNPLFNNGTSHFYSTYKDLFSNQTLRNIFNSKVSQKNAGAYLNYTYPLLKIMPRIIQENIALKEKSFLIQELDLLGQSLPLNDKVKNHKI